jgi:hypothetical protein
MGAFFYEENIFSKRFCATNCRKGLERMKWSDRPAKLLLPTENRLQVPLIASGVYQENGIFRFISFEKNPLKTGNVHTQSDIMWSRQTSFHLEACLSFFSQYDFKLAEINHTDA